MAVDGSEFSDKAFHATMELAKLLNAEATAVHVVPTPVPAEDISPDVLAAMEKSYQREGEAVLSKYGTMAKEKYGYKIGTILAKGHAGRKILEVADQNRADLIIMGHRGIGRLKELFLGSVSNYVVHNSKVSVMIVR